MMTSDSLREHRRQAVATAGTAGAARLLVDDVFLGRLVAKQLAFGAGCLQQAGANESLMARVLLFGFLAFWRQLFARSKSVAGQHAFASCFGPGRDPIFVHWTDEIVRSVFYITRNGGVGSSKKNASRLFLI